MVNLFFVSILFLFAILFFYLYFFITRDFYFGKSTAEETTGQVLKKEEQDRFCRYKVSFTEKDGTERTAMTTWYRNNNNVKEGDDAILRYADFQLMTHPVLAVRVVRSDLTRKKDHRLLGFAAASLLIAMATVMLAAL